MIIISRNGFKVDVKPNCWFNPIDLWEFLKSVWEIKRNDVYLDPKAWKWHVRKTVE